MGYYSWLTRNDLLSQEKTWRKHKCILIGEGSWSEKITSYMVPTMWHSRKGKAVETVERSVIARSWGRDKEASYKGFLEQENALYNTIMTGTCLSQLSKPTECMIPKMNPNVNYGLGLIMMCQYTFITCNKYSPLVGDVCNGGGYA